MSWRHSAAKLPGSSIDTRPLKDCGRCNSPQPTPGGVQLSPTKWCCATCWKKPLFTNAAEKMRSAYNDSRKVKTP